MKANRPQLGLPMRCGQAVECTRNVRALRSAAHRRNLAPSRHSGTPLGEHAMSGAAAPSPIRFRAIRSGTIDDQIVNPELYQNETIHDVYAKLRREDPVHWTEPIGFRPFWSVTEARRHSRGREEPPDLRQPAAHLSLADPGRGLGEVDDRRHASLPHARRSRRSHPHEAARADAKLVHAAELEEARGAHRADRQGSRRPHAGAGQRNATS